VAFEAVTTVDRRLQLTWSESWPGPGAPEALVETELAALATSVRRWRTAATDTPVRYGEVSAGVSQTLKVGVFAALDELDRAVAVSRSHCQ